MRTYGPPDSPDLFTRLHADGCEQAGSGGGGPGQRAQSIRRRSHCDAQNESMPGGKATETILSRHASA